MLWHNVDCQSSLGLVLDFEIELLDVRAVDIAGFARQCQCGSQAAVILFEVGCLVSGADVLCVDSLLGICWPPSSEDGGMVKTGLKDVGVPASVVLQPPWEETVDV